MQYEFCLNEFCKADHLLRMNSDNRHQRAKLIVAVLPVECIDGNPVALDRHQGVDGTSSETIERIQGFQEGEEEAKEDIKRSSFTYPDHNSDVATCELFPHFNLLNYMHSGSNLIKSFPFLVYSLIR